MKRRLEVAFAMITSCGDEVLNQIATENLIDMMEEDGQYSVFEVMGCLSALAKNFLVNWAAAEDVPWEVLRQKVMLEMLAVADD